MTDWRERAWGPKGTPFFRRMAAAWRRFSKDTADYQRVWREKHPGKAYASSRTWLAKNPEAQAAHSAVKYALKTGRLQRQPCTCGAAKAHAHHEDYTKLLEVVWLCRRCHRAVHQRRGLP